MTTPADLLICCLASWFSTYLPATLPGGRTSKVASDFLDAVERRLREDPDSALLHCQQLSHPESAHGLEYSTLRNTIAKLAEAVALTVTELDSSLSLARPVNACEHKASKYSEINGHIFIPARATLAPALPKLCQAIGHRGHTRKQMAPAKTAKAYWEAAHHALTAGKALSSAIVVAVRTAGESDDEQKWAELATEAVTIAQCLLSDDPRWRFINGITFEGGQESSYLLRFLIYALFGSTYKLGLDPTVKQHLIHRHNSGTVTGGKNFDVVASYEYTVDSGSYLTEGPPIYEDTLGTSCRGTRVWLAWEMSKVEGDEEQYTLSEELYVLKDIWLACDAELESHIRGDIFARLRALDSQSQSSNTTTNHAEEAERYFMHFRHDWHVECVDGHDISPDIPTDVEFYVQSGNKYDNIKHYLRHHAIRLPGRFLTAHASVNAAAAQYAHRKHIRTILEDVCDNIYEIKDYKTLFRALRDTVKGITLAFLPANMSDSNIAYVSQSD
ncbi:hypothetical protein DXG03_001078 [Asterophora parasitica]|uniref:Fungal-type protein kinase domain-containing protein n=1 Tax=Asterophora parasitica TaxID=117018 RepID=A0A9P7GBP9_9AGAR|nr:hypothetical protein DXG03_001078 [Asterophora parasitica]